MTTDTRTPLPLPTESDKAFFLAGKIHSSLHTRITIERAVFRKAVETLLAAGFELRVHEGGDWACARTTDPKVLEDAMMSTDEDRLYAFRPDNAAPFGWVYFVYGNTGWDVVADHTAKLDAFLTPVDAYVDQIAEWF